MTSTAPHAAKRIRVLIADDHALFRAGIRALIQCTPGFTVVGEAGDGREALRLVGAKHPDVVLMDITMPGLNGLEATARVTHDFPKVGIVILSMHAEEDFFALAFRAGARGYLLKHADRAELELAVRAVAQGDTYLSREIARPVIARYAAGASAAGGSPDPRDQLTSRQREVLQLIAEGQTSRAIAQRLRVSLKTVEAHRSRLMDRLAIRDVAGLVRWAIRHRVVNLET